MQSHACRPRSQLRRWERCIADQPGLAGGVCAPSCSDHFVPAGCTATTCVPRKEQPDNLATEEARPGETSRDAPTTPRRSTEPGPEPKARPEPELESGPEAEPEPTVDKDESPSSGSGSSHGSCNGNNSKGGSRNRCTSETAPKIVTQARGGEANGGHGRLEARSVDCTRMDKTEEGCDERVPSLEGRGGCHRDPSGFAAPQRNQPGVVLEAGAGMETGAAHELSMSVSTESEATMTTTTMTVALADEGAAAVMSSAKTNQPVGGSSSAFPTSVVEAEKGGETDEPFEQYALEGATDACGRHETGAGEEGEEEEQEAGREGGEDASSRSLGPKLEVSAKSGLARTLSERLDALFGLAPPADAPAEKLLMTPEIAPVSRANLEAASTQGGGGGSGGGLSTCNELGRPTSSDDGVATEDALFAARSFRRRGRTDGPASPSSMFPFMVASVVAPGTNRDVDSSSSPSSDQGRGRPPEVVGGVPAPESSRLFAVAGSRSLDEYFVSGLVMGGGGDERASDVAVVAGHPGNGKTASSRDRDGQVPPSPSCGRAGCSEPPVYGPKGVRPSWCRLHYVWQTLGRPSRCSFLLSKSAVSGKGVACWEETTWAVPGKRPTRCEQHKKSGMVHVASVLRAVFSEVVWPKLVERGWRAEGSNKSSKNKTTKSKNAKNTWWLPPNVVRNSKAFKGRVDYFDTRPQVIKHCLRTEQHYGWIMAEYLRLAGGDFCTPVEAGAGDEGMALHAEPPNAELPNAAPPNAGPPSFMLPLPTNCPADIAPRPGRVESVAGLDSMYSRGGGRVNSRAAPARLTHVSHSNSSNGGVSVGGGSSSSHGGGASRQRIIDPQQYRQDGQTHEQKGQRPPAPSRANVFTHQLFSVNPSPSRAKCGESARLAAERSLIPPLSSAMAWSKSARSGPWSPPRGARPQEYRSHRAARMRAAGIDTTVVTREALEESERARAAFFVRMGENGENAIDPLKTLVDSVHVLGCLNVLGEKRAAVGSNSLLVREQRQSASPDSTGGRNDGAKLRRPGDSGRGSNALAAAYGGGSDGGDASLWARAGHREIHGRFSGVATATAATTTGGRRVAGADALLGAPARAAVTKGSCSPWKAGASVLAPGVSSSRERARRLESNPRDGLLARGGCGGKVGGDSSRGSDSDSVSGGVYGGSEEEEDEEWAEEERVEERVEEREDAGVRQPAAAEDSTRQLPPLPEVEPAPTTAALGWQRAEFPRPSTIGGSAAAGMRAEARRVRLDPRAAAAKGAESGTDGDVRGEEAESIQRVQSKRKADCLIEETGKRPPSPPSSPSDRRGERCEAPANDGRTLRFGSLPPGLGPFGAGVDRSRRTSSFSIQASCDAGR